MERRKRVDEVWKKRGERGESGGSEENRESRERRKRRKSRKRMWTGQKEGGRWRKRKKDRIT